MCACSREGNTYPNFAERSNCHKDRKVYMAKQRAAAAAHLECDKLQHNIEHLKSAAICLRNAGMYLMSAKLFEKLHEVSIKTHRQVY